MLSHNVHVRAFLYATRRYNIFRRMVASANRSNDPVMKSYAMKKMFQWRKQAEQFKTSVDLILEK